MWLRWTAVLHFGHRCTFLAPLNLDHPDPLLLLMHCTYQKAGIGGICLQICTSHGHNAGVQCTSGCPMPTATAHLGNELRMLHTAIIWFCKLRLDNCVRAATHAWVSGLLSTSPQEQRGHQDGEVKYKLLRCSHRASQGGSLQMQLQMLVHKCAPVVHVSTADVNVTHTIDDPVARLCKLDLRVSCDPAETVYR